MTHPELCRLTAERFVKKARFALWEYQSFASGEFPDVLIFHSYETVLYEIKMSRADFLADAKKEARIKWKPHPWWPKAPAEQFRIEKPHLGATRFFVCLDGMILPHEIPEGWGLYWVKGDRFFKKKDSGKFRADVRTERNLAAHAMQRLASGNSTGIIVNTFSNVMGEA